MCTIVKTAKPKTGKKPPRTAAAADDLISKLSQLSSGKPAVKPAPASSSDTTTKPLVDSQRKPKPNGKAAAALKATSDGSASSASESVVTEKPAPAGTKAKGSKINSNNTAKRPPTGTALASDQTAGANMTNGAATDVAIE